MNHFLLTTFFVVLCTLSAQAADPLPSWNDCPTKRAIIEFVDEVTDKDGDDFVPEPARIATFDNDGTLWSEQPMYFQVAFAIDRVKQQATAHPQWKKEEPFATILHGDRREIAELGEKQLLQVIAATHAGMTADEFAVTVKQWMATARHPRFDRPYNELIYQPMLELLAYLRANGFKTFIVSGGGVDFMRPWVDQAYGIPPEQVVGSSGKLKYELRDGQPILLKLAEVNFVDDRQGKPIGIQQHIGRRPIAAFGNSDGDYEMLRWTTAGEGPRLGMIVHHTDAKREWAYDRDSAVGRLDRALNEAEERGWHVMDMKKDWRVIYPFEK
jgi:phosphoglycolate phosphatase-like HAD superfamily hydrolase